MEWEKDNIRLVLGDCRAVLESLPAASVDCVLTDPPYGHNNNDGDLISNWEKALGEEREADAPRPILNDGPEANEIAKFIFAQSARLLRHGGCCCCCCCGGGGPDPMFARWSLWLDQELEFKQMVVWDKGPIGMGWHYRRSYECVLVAQKRGGPCKWYDDSGSVENIIRPGQKGIRKIIPGPDDHPTPKPVELAEHFIRLHTQPGDTVLDPCMGRGWVALACVRLGRKFIGVELDPEHYHKAVEKVDAALGAGGLFAGGTTTKQTEAALW